MDFYSDIVYQTLGSNRESLFEKIKKKEAIHTTLLELRKQRESIDGVLDEINQMTDVTDLPSFDFLGKQIEENKNKIINAQREAGRQKEKLLKAYDEREHLIELVNGIEQYLNQKQSDEKWVSSTHQCPYCKNEIRDPSDIYFSTATEKERSMIDKGYYSGELAEAQKQITSLEESYKKALADMSNLEKDLFGFESNYESILTKYSYRDLKQRVVTKRFSVDSSIEANLGNEKAISQQIEVLKKEEESIDKSFLLNLSGMHVNYDNAGVVIEKVTTADSNKFGYDGNSIHSAQTLWLCSLLRTQAEFLKGKEGVFLPIVFDDPVNADFDGNSRDAIIRMVFDSVPEGGQVVFSEVGFPEEDYKKKYQPNVIFLRNAREHVLNSDDFEKGFQLYSDLLPSSCFISNHK